MKSMDSSALTFFILAAILFLDPTSPLQYPQELIDQLYPDLIINGERAHSPSPAEAPAAAASSPLVPALFVIGDSSVDSGTNNFLGTFARADRPPYGRDFDTGQPTGRFCNGRIPVDYIGNSRIFFFFDLVYVNRNHRFLEVLPFSSLLIAILRSSVSYLFFQFYGISGCYGG